MKFIPSNILIFFEASKNEVFVDCGCFDGNDILKFVKWCGYEYNKIFAFEISDENYNNILDNECIQVLDNCKIFNYGLWNESSELAFCEFGMNSGFVELNERQDKIKQAVKLDEVLKRELVTLIKMDIEGAEMNALKGAENIIKEYKPRLEICVYHKPQDIMDIPDYILSLNSEYNFALRHYTFANAETVLYCYS